MCELRQMIVV